MTDHARENLTELLRQFMDESAAQAAQRDIESAERILDAHPAPVPSPETLSAIKLRMVATTRRHSLRVRIFRTVAAAAAVVLIALIGRYGQRPTGRSGVNMASIIPTAVWESHDIAADDLDLAYFTSQIRQIETEMEVLENGDVGTDDHDTLDDIEVELIATDTEFWKG